MTPHEDFDHQVLLFVAITTAHLVRCADKASILDEDAAKSVRAHFTNLSEAAVELDEPQVLAWIDLLAKILPPLASSDSSPGS